MHSLALIYSYISKIQATTIFKCHMVYIYANLNRYTSKFQGEDYMTVY